MDKTLKLCIGCVAFLMISLLGMSFMNAQQFYIKPVKAGIEICQGRFAPKGEKHLITLPENRLPATAKKVYNRYDVFPMIFNYYIKKADDLLNVTGIPNFENIKHYIELSQPYAATKELRNAAAFRLDSMEQLLLMYKADVAAQQGDASDIETALSLLEKAKAISIDNSRTELLDKKIKSLSNLLEQINAQTESTPPSPPSKHE